MKFKLIALAASVALLSQASFSAPQRGTVTFNGLVTKSPVASCVINTPNTVVNLGSEKLSDIIGKTDPIRATPFSIGLTCNATSTGSVGAYFDNAGSTNTISNGDLVSSGTAKNINIRMYNATNGATIKLGLVGMPASGAPTFLVKPSVTMGYSAGFFAAAGQTPTDGTVAGQLTYILVYI